MYIATKCSVGCVYCGNNVAPVICSLRYYIIVVLRTKGYICDVASYAVYWWLPRTLNIVFETNKPAKSGYKLLISLNKWNNFINWANVAISQMLSIKNIHKVRFSLNH